MLRYCLGKKPARKGAISFRLRDYVDLSKLPPIPNGDIGHDKLVAPQTWGVLGNDEVGDCFWAGAAHETMLWNKEAGKAVKFSTASVLSDYSASTGFDPKNPNSDQGTDVADGMSYRRKVGVIDADGNRHKIAAYLEVTPGDLQEHRAACYLFGATGVGIEFPDYALDQFNNNQPWDVRPNGQIQGGHYIPMVAARDGGIVIVTWGREQLMTEAFLKKYEDEAVVMISEEMLREGRSIEGFDKAALEADLAALGK
jgi:hypothetical protein